MDSIGSKIRAIRLVRGMNLLALAAATGIEYTWLSRIETGKAIPTDEQLTAIKAALSWPSDEAVEAAFELLSA